MTKVISLPEVPESKQVLLLHKDKLYFFKYDWTLAHATTEDYDDGEQVVATLRRKLSIKVAAYEKSTAKPLEVETLKVGNVYYAQAVGKNEYVQLHERLITAEFGDKLAGQIEMLIKIKAALDNGVMNYAEGKSMLPLLNKVTLKELEEAATFRLSYEPNEYDVEFISKTLDKLHRLGTPVKEYKVGQFTPVQVIKFVEDYEKETNHTNSPIQESINF